MIDSTLNQLAQLLRTKINGEDCIISSVSTDTRDIKPGALFVALAGERFDGHNFITQAIEKGASAVLVSRAVAAAVPQLVVSDTKIALGVIASWIHQQCDTPTIAITGSCGKTTVKEMAATILSRKGAVLYTHGNLNNDIGVPLTLLRSRPEDDVAIIELGANHTGEIDYTAGLVCPDIALVNNVAAAHLEGFGSIDGVKTAKGEIYKGLKPGGIAIVNLDSCGGKLWQEALHDKVVKTISVTDPQADYCVSSITSDEMAYPGFVLHTPKGSCEINLGIMGVHNVNNALAAAALAMEAGAKLDDIQAGLELSKNIAGRCDVSQLTAHIRLIDDSYNASVPSMLAAADMLGRFPSERWLILGYMAELGSEAVALHRQVGEHAATFGFEHILTYGSETKVISEICGGIHFDSHQDIIDYINSGLDKENLAQHVLLVKGAHSAGMSKVVTALKEKYA
ncbi:UDP-N-acetylmuramoyl-tripeptide--D-alanyl-D-alanine ligase [Vibrio quintilis]|uniref:UDP-N-acetylmuramoyl-tripeptide--D-alanyl-D-alanine ligase n=1 Tax=Vibrio quintilis TaxID=1117707 RepID=A0A1M7YVN0_9VIBR|nr:UDP-N-acetylmuramoyl-tripeptide--D-alanyl-D-alanine ligase [Vibrio quintilis]SHO56719.1 UDP-N-acetylmuramoyl-tripeptide--D-alanyl-D-alanine ligase [Vibrio quintilis]